MDASQVRLHPFRAVPVALALILNAVIGPLAPAISQTVAPLSGAVFGAADPDHVSFTLEGCRLTAGETLPNADGKFICADADYTTGNLGKLWNELDLVPHRLTADNGDGAQTYAVAIAADNMDAGHPGYDVISVPVLNTALSTGTCSITASPQLTQSPGQGGADTTIYRILTITQSAGSTCVFDWYQRLALGSHLYPGSSLHSNLLNQQLSSSGIGSKEVSIPVKEILPQELSKTMTATVGQAYSWSISKSANPTSLDLENTCATTPGARSASVDVTVTWTRSGPTASGATTITTTVTATNPAHRIITVNVTDKIYAGSTQTTLLDTASSGAVDVAAGSDAVVLTHTFVYNGSATSFNDVATATYTDKDTGIAVPGNTTATASANAVASQDPAANASAIVTDTESITGTGLSFAVAAPSVGSFTNYTAGNSTTGPVNWSSGTVSASGSVTFHKTVSVSGPMQTTGSLSDTATVTSGEITSSEDLSIPITSSASVSLTISKTIPNVLGSGQTATFTFDISGPGGYTSQKTLTFNQGDTSKSTTITGLAPGTYTVHEQPASGWNNQDDQEIDLNLPNCSATASFTNTFSPASAEVQKITVPAGHEAGWTFYLNGPGASNVAVTTTGAGFISFPTDLAEGTYTITEQPKAGWNQTSASGCQFTVDYPADSGKTFQCSITNTAVGISISKANDDADGIVNRGQSIHYTITVTITNGPADDVVVTDTVPAGLTYTSDSAVPSTGFSADGQNLEWTVGTLASGTYAFEYDATVNSDASGNLTNNACIDSSDLLASPGPKPLCDTTTVTVIKPAVSIVKSNDDQDGKVLPGQTVNYDLTVTVTNGPAHDVVVTDTIPAGLTYTAGSADPSTGFLANGQHLTWTVGTLASGTYHFTYAVTVDSNAHGDLANLGCVAASDDANNDVENLLCDTTTLHVIPSVSIVKQNNAEGTVTRGSTVHYTLTVTVSNGPAHDVVVTDTLPSGVEYKTGTADPSAGFSVDGQKLTWTVGTLATGVHHVEYDGLVTNDAPINSELTNVGCVAASDDNVNDETNPICDTSTIEVTPPEITILKSSNHDGDTVVRGQTIDYLLTITVMNGPMHNAVATDTLPDGLTYKAGSADPAPFSVAGQVITWHFATLTGETTISYQATVDSDAQGILTNLGCVKTDEQQDELCSQTHVNVTPPTLLIEKSVDKSVVDVTEGVSDAARTVTWTLTYTLTNGPVHNAVISDPLPAGLDAPTNISDGGIFAGGMITWTFPVLSDGGSVSFKTRISDSVGGGVTITNVATIESKETPPDTGTASTTTKETPPPQAATPTPMPSVPNTAMVPGQNGQPIQIPIEFLVIFFLGSLGALTLANVKAVRRRR